MTDILGIGMLEEGIVSAWRAFYLMSATTLPILLFNTDLRKALRVSRHFRSVTNLISEYSGFQPTSCET